MAQEFHISVNPLGENKYWVRTEWVAAPGAVPFAEEQVTWQVEDWLAQARHLMNDPLLMALSPSDTSRSGSPNREVTQSSLNLVALGQQLYDALFQGTLRDSWMIAQAIAQDRQEVLRLRLGLKDSRLLSLPWEVLHDGDRPLATVTDVAFSRYQTSTRLRSPTVSLGSGSNQPLLKILMAIAAPNDQESLALKQEVSHLQAELSHRSRNGLPEIQLTVLEQPGTEQLTHELEQGQYQVFHYAGHSDQGAYGGNLYLVSRQTGLTEMLSGDDLAGLLVNNGVQLAVFNSCRGAHTAASDPSDGAAEGNLAEALVKRGIKSVLAMAERIPDQVALTLARRFYGNLNQGYPIDLSLSRARQSLISTYGSRQLYWALPILYLHPEFDGYLTPGHHAINAKAERLQLPDATGADLAWGGLGSTLSNREEEAVFTAPAVSRSGFLSTDEASDVSLEDDLYGYDDPDWVDPVDDLEYDDIGYEDDSAMVADLFRQLKPEPLAAEAHRETEADQQRDRPGERENLTTITAHPLLVSKTSPQPVTPAIAAQSAPKNAGSEESLLGYAARKPWQRFWQRGDGKDAQRRVKRVPLRALLALGSTMAIALLGFWLLQRRPQPSDLLFSQEKPITSLPALPSPNLKNVNLQTANTPTVTAIAIEQFSQNNLSAAVVAVEELLNRGALPQAQGALDNVSKQKIDDPAISFLRGRLAWQSVQTGSKDYSLDDARRFWELAVKKQPKSAKYLNALGFAYYLEGNLDRANQIWFDAFYLIEEKPAAVAGSVAQQEALTTYAGLAIGLSKLAASQPADKQAKLLDEARKLRQKAISEDPVNLQPEALSKNWLWSEKAIKDWRSLLSASQK
ncbi:CHAT domain-containing protein [Coleofasciculus sp. H7-2]|uniref:CHAT domain-containing protein n=1 Tax=Coleofasciculus sp. H7-2 TaxID=3351545 RepID=UPI00366D652E